MPTVSTYFINLCVLVAFTYVGSLTYTGAGQNHVSRYLLRYLLSVAAGAALIYYAVTLGPGVRVDYRFIPVALAGLFGGPMTALAVAVPLTAYRFSIGGVGAPAGMISLLVCALLSSAFSPLFRNRQITRRTLWVPPLLFALTDLSVLLIPGQGVTLFKATYPAIVALHSLGLFVTFAVLNGRFIGVAQASESERLAYRDGLTGLLNRRAFDRDLRALPESRPQVFLLLLDIDHFKAINDERGHPFGDRVLTTLSGVLQESLHGHDRVYRIGGEEFAVVLHQTNPAGAALVAERVRRDVSAQVGVRSGDADLNVTVSVGLTDWTGPDGHSLQTADHLLYQAKGNGRNQVRLAPHLTDFGAAVPPGRSGRTELST